MFILRAFKDRWMNMRQPRTILNICYFTPAEVTKNRFDGITSEYNITGLPDKDGNQLEMWVSFEAQRKGQLTVDSVVPSFMKNKIPLSKAAFMRFINNYLDQKKLIYTIRTRKRMSEQNVNRSDIEHALKNPRKVGDGVAQKHAPGNVVYLRGETANKNLLHLGISLEKQGKIAVTTVGRILNNQIPLPRKDFIRFVSDYIATGKGIVYTRFRTQTAWMIWPLLMKILNTSLSIRSE